MNTTDSQFLISASQLTHAYGNHRVLESLSFDLSPGEFVSFIGPSGCGKTTLLKLVTGLIRPQSGTLRVTANRLSYVFQSDSLLPWRTALENVLLPFELEGKSISPSQRQRAWEQLDLMGLADFADYFPNELSGGMKKRVELARALVTEPSLLILDEPFASLDIITRERLNLLLRSLQTMSKAGVLMVTHFVEEACFLSNKVYVLSEAPARILDAQSLSGLRDGSEDAFVLTPRELEIAHEIKTTARELWAPHQLLEKKSSAVAWSNTPAKATRGPRMALSAAFFLDGLSRAILPLEILFFYVAWIVIKKRFSISDFILPHPNEILRRFAGTLADGSILRHIGITVGESLTGFFLALTLALLMGYSIAKIKPVGRLLMPPLIAANTLPSVALAPFLVLWFGFGLTPIIFVATLVIFFPLLVNTVAAVRHAEKACAELVLFYKPTLWQKFTKFELPAAIPVVFNGIKVSITLSVIGAVVGEFVSGTEGLGALVQSAKANFDTPLMFVALGWLILLGLGYFTAAQLIYGWIQKQRRDL